MQEQKNGEKAKNVEDKIHRRMPLLSVIVPVYNAELYVRKCIQSIQEQTYKNIEIIIVDDGSKDASVQICRELAAQDSRIIFLEANHKGVVSARNAGIDCATGEYITFVDSDDWIENDLYTQMIDEMGDADLLATGRYVHTNRVDVVYQCMQKGVYSGKGMHEIWRSVGCEGVSCYVWDKMFRRNIVNLIYKLVDETIRWSEDSVFVKKYLLYCQTIRISDITGYHYYLRDGSASWKTDIHCLNEIDKWYNSMLEAYNLHPYGDNLLKSLADDVVRLVGMALHFKMDLKNKDWLVYFPYYGRLDGKKVILYGAGEVGKAYHTHIRIEPEVELVLWVDKNYKEYRKKGMDVCAVDRIEQMEYDFIIVAVWHKELYMEIRKELLSLGVDEEKILYNRTKRLLLELF